MVGIATTAAAVAAVTLPVAAHAQASAPIQLPPVNANFDYQIGQGYTPPPGVTVVDRDHDDTPAKGLYNICYINAFQAQQGAESSWRGRLLTKNGKTVYDQDWNEALLDISTAASRTAIMKTIGGWIDECASKGFKAIEPDNYDSYQRSEGLLTPQESEAYMSLLVQRAHADGLAIAQKNTLELAGDAAKLGIDFAVSEQCGANWDGSQWECADYQKYFGRHVIDIEYDDDGLTVACSNWSNTFSIVERDINVSSPDQDGYVRETCAG